MRIFLLRYSKNITDGGRIVILERNQSDSQGLKKDRTTRMIAPPTCEAYRTSRIARLRIR
jgi:hypothetical protein